MPSGKRFWLMKTEPDSYSIDDLKRDGSTSWDGVRNFQARNFIRDLMKPGDEALFYHSSTEPPGVAGLARISKPAFPDRTAFDKKDHHHDPKSTPEKPTWYAVEISFIAKFKRVVGLDAIKANAALKGIMVAARGSRLSIQPVSPEHFTIIKKMGTPI